MFVPYKIDLAVASFFEHSNLLPLSPRISCLDGNGLVEEALNFFERAQASLIFERLLQSHIEHLERVLFEDVEIWLEVHCKAWRYFLLLDLIPLLIRLYRFPVNFF